METERLIIRGFVSDDWKALHEMIVLNEASEVAIYDNAWPTEPEKIKGVVEWFASGDRFLAVCLKDTGRFIGFVALNPEQEVDRREYNLGYIFHADYHGKGYASEACRAVIGRAFSQNLANRVIAGTAAANLPSCRMLERLGFKKTGESMGSLRNGADGRPIEFLGRTYELTRDDWEALTAD
jgi:[ribosomal protein S5]-alanine N-acetyltransferase